MIKYSESCNDWLKIVLFTSFIFLVHDIHSRIYSFSCSGALIAVFYALMSCVLSCIRWEPCSDYIKNTWRKWYSVLSSQTSPRPKHKAASCWVSCKLNVTCIRNYWIVITFYFVLVLYKMLLIWSFAFRLIAGKFLFLKCVNTIFDSFFTWNYHETLSLLFTHIISIMYVKSLLIHFYTQPCISRPIEGNTQWTR